MDSDTDSQLILELARKTIVEIGQPPDHRHRAVHGVLAARSHIGFEAIQGHEPIAGKLRIVSASFLECL